MADGQKHTTYLAKELVVEYFIITKVCIHLIRSLYKLYKRRARMVTIATAVTPAMSATGTTVAATSSKSHRITGTVFTYVHVHNSLKS